MALLRRRVGATLRERGREVSVCGSEGLRTGLDSSVDCGGWTGCRWPEYMAVGMGMGWVWLFAPRKM